MTSSSITKNEVRQAQLPHQLFLFNTIGNHVLLTVITVSVAMSSPLWTLLVPIVSVSIIGYTIIKGVAVKNHPSPFVRCHWGICIRRTRIFLIGYGVLAFASTAGWLLYSYVGIMKELAFALVGGLGLLPLMVLVLALTIFESESLSHAGQEFIPDWARRCFGTEDEIEALEAELAELADATLDAGAK